MTAVVTALAAVTRFLNLGSPTDVGTPIFDEKHYAPQAWQVLHNHGIEDNPGYGLVVHPPVGKQLIAMGEALFGYTGLGWRFAGAVCGVITVLLVVRIARRISRSTVVGGIAGLLLVADGVSFVAARTALLDGFLVVFVVAAFGCLIVDRDQVRERMHVVLLEGRISETPWGPRLGVRWWRFGAGILLGLACATKWSGLYFVAFFGVMTLAFDIAARRQSRVPRPWLGAFRRDLGRRSMALVLIPFVSTWRRTRRGSRRRPGDSTRSAERSARTASCRCTTHCARCGITPRRRTVSFRPDQCRRQPPPWESIPRTSPSRCAGSSTRSTTKTCQDAGTNLVKAAMLVGTPAIWFMALLVLAWALWGMLSSATGATPRSSWATAQVPAVVADIDRQMYSFSRRRWRRSWCRPSR